MHAWLLKPRGRFYDVVREERGVFTVFESGLGWEDAVAERLRHEKRDPPPRAEQVAMPAVVRCTTQPGRRKFAAPKALTRAGRSRVKWCRPYCLACQQFMPAPDEPREYWIEAFGHADLNGEPCPSGKHVVVLSPFDRRVILEMRAANAANPKRRKRRRKKKLRKGRRARRRWVQMWLVDSTPTRERTPKVKLVRVAIEPRWEQLSWLDGPVANDQQTARRTA